MASNLETKINRVQNNVNYAMERIAARGVDVPETANSDDLGNLIDEIPSGGGDAANAVLYTPQELTDEQAAQARENIGAANEKTTVSETDYTSGFAKGYINVRDVDIGAVINIDAPVSHNSYVYCVFPVSAGDIVVATATGYISPQAWAFLDADRELYARSGGNVTIKELALKVEKDGYCIIQSKAAEEYSAKVIKNASLLEKLSNHEGEIYEKMRFLLSRNYVVEYANAPSALASPYNYRKNVQNVHPSVLYFANGFGGHKYWMAYTPYPNGVSTYENPCIAFSEDGINWNDIASNPLDIPETVSSPKTSYNSDTHLVYREDSKQLECWFRHCIDSTTTASDRRETIYRMVSSDGLTWQDKTQMFVSSGTTNYALSPVVMFDNSTKKYRMWLRSNRNDTPKLAYYETGANDTAFAEVRLYDLTFTHESREYRPWHMDVALIDGVYVMLVMCKYTFPDTSEEDWILFMTKSEDNVTYSTPEVVMVGNSGAWDHQIYRSCLVKTDAGYRIYYSARSDKSTGNWIYGISISESKKLSNFVGLF